MSSSLFQLFPENIATTIVRHLVSSTACSTALQAIPPAVSALNALLQVNKLWRKAVLDCVYEKCVISINRQNKLDTSVSPMIPLAGKLPLSDICDKVRHLQLNVDCNFIDLQIYLDNWNPKAGTVLRNVECVEFVLVSSISNIDRFRLGATLKKLFLYVEALVPAPANVCIRYGDGPHLLAFRGFKVLYSEFKSLYSQISIFSAACLKDMNRNSTAVTGLSAIELATDYIHNGHIEFVRANCLTLKSLVISSKNNYALDCLFTNELIVYPQLKTLKLLLGSYTYNDVTLSVPEQHTPCPNLRFLEVSKCYLFDDILLNSNMPYLEYLNIGCTKHVIHLAKKNNLFDLKLPSLRHMVLQQSYGTAFEHVSMEELGKVAFGLAPNIYTLELTGTRSNSDFFAYIPADAQLNSLRSVFMPAIDMDLSDVVYLLKSAPAVEELKCSSIIIGNELEEIEPAKWPDFVYENCHPLGPNFSKLTVSKLTSVWRQARVFMLIAIMCPRFLSVVVNECKQGKFKSCLYSLNTAKQYAPFNRYSINFSICCHLYTDATAVV